MIKFNKTTLLASLLLPGFALAQVNAGDILGTEEVAINASLEAQGYVVTGFEAEDDEIEVDVTLDGIAYEIEISSQDGTVLEVELDEVDDDSDQG
jgi:hypothetical protein